MWNAVRNSWRVRSTVKGTKRTCLRRMPSLSVVPLLLGDSEDVYKRQVFSVEAAERTISVLAIWTVIPGRAVFPLFHDCLLYTSNTAYIVPAIATFFFVHLVVKKYGKGKTTQ